MTAIRQDFHARPWLYDVWQAFILLDEEAHDARYSVPASLDFAPADVESLDEQASRLRVALPGLLGPIGPAPMHLTESTIRQTRLGNNALQDFLDIFHNRFLRLWREQALAMCPELGPAHDHNVDDPDSVWLLAVAGMLTAGLRHNPLTAPSRTLHARGAVEIPDAAFFLHAGLWRVFPRSAEGVKRLVRTCLNVEIGIEQFVGAWVEIPDRARCRLGGKKTLRRLGHSALIGSRAFHDAAGVRIHALHGEFLDQRTRDAVAALFIAFAGTDLRLELTKGRYKPKT